VAFLRLRENMKKLADQSDAELIEALGAARILRLAGSVRGRRQTPHAGPGAPQRPTNCPVCDKLQPSAAAAKAHCAGKRRAKAGGKQMPQVRPIRYRSDQAVPLRLLKRRLILETVAPKPNVNRTLTERPAAKSEIGSKKMVQVGAGKTRKSPSGMIPQGAELRAGGIHSPQR
jgi:hypothetical protein